MINRKDELILNLEKRGYTVKFFETKEEAVSYMSGEIKGKTVGIGGSMTVSQIGLAESLSKNNTVYSHWNKALIDELGSKEVMKRAAFADVYISSANGLALTGEIVNIDGTGNRIAATAYGHEKVYFVAGINKVTENLHTAIYRAQNVAAPINAKRLGKKTPCAVNADKCYNCNSPERICKGTLIFDRPMSGMAAEIVLINENLGA